MQQRLGEARQWLLAKAWKSARTIMPDLARDRSPASDKSGITQVLPLQLNRLEDDIHYLAEPGSRDEPPIGGDVKAKGVRWDMLMVFYLRLMAGAWMLRGFGYWAMVIGLSDVPLSEERRLRQAFIVGFAILDCSAAVGLWLLTPWGKSLWLALAFLEILLGVTGYARMLGLADAASTLVGVAAFGALAYAMRRQRF